MSIPLVTNREPSSREVAGVLSTFRFSARTSAEVVNPSTVAFHTGAGPVFWPGGYLPETDGRVTFALKALTGLIPRQPAVCTIMPDHSLRLQKLIPAQDQEGIYVCGGLESPADPQSTLMLEFALALAQADVVPDFMGFTGVLTALKNGNTGITVKFFTDGATRRIEIHDAQYTTAVPPAPRYVALYDWDQGQPHTYKLLWSPQLNVVQLYVSAGQDVDTPDTLLIDGFSSDFPGPLPEIERPLVQPIAYFGHGYLNPTSTSYWYNFYFHNKVSSPVINGLFQGKHTGSIRTDESTWYYPTALPRNHDHPWSLLPASFGELGGVEELTTSGELWLTRIDETKSFGFLRREPGLASGLPSMFDFQVSGELLKREPGIGESTGMELYIDDGVRQIRFALLDAAGTQSIGLLTGSLPEKAASYGGQQVNWVNPSSYRIWLDPLVGVRLSRMTLVEEGVDEEVIMTGSYGVFPASGFPGPGFGFLHNANTIAARARLKIGRLRYAVDLRYIPLPPDFPGANWVESAAHGVVASSDGALELQHTDPAGSYFFYRNEPGPFLGAGLNSEKGFLVEFRAKVPSYEIDGVENPIRRATGVGVSVDDGTYQYLLMFAEMGPPNGRIIFLATTADLDQNLFDIRALASSADGTYAAVDWSIYHIYRLEKQVGGKLALYVDDVNKPVISFDTRKFTPIPSEGHDARVRFGSLLPGRTSTSLWKFLRYNVSRGYDVSAFPKLTDAQVAGRFSNGLNTIAAAEAVHP